MIGSNQIAEIAAALGDPVRVNMLLALRDEGTLTAGQLATIGNVAPSTASEHLSRLTACRLINPTREGRQRLYSIADRDLCDVLDGIETLGRRNQAADKPPPPGVMHSRLCYDHLAGRLGCALSAALFGAGHLAHCRGGVAVTANGAQWLAGFDIDTGALEAEQRCTLRLCCDWMLDDHHLGGAVAGAMLKAFRARDWLRIRRGSPLVEVTPIGAAVLRKDFGIDLGG